MSSAVVYPHASFKVGPGFFILASVVATKLLVNQVSAKLTLNIRQIRLFELQTLAYRNDAGRHN